MFIVKVWHKSVSFNNGQPVVSRFYTREDAIRDYNVDINKDEVLQVAFYQDETVLSLWYDENDFKSRP